MGFLVVESCTVKKEGNKKINKEAHTYRKSRQEAFREGMTTYSIRDTVNKAAKVPSGIIKAATNDINNGKNLCYSEILENKNGTHQKKDIMVKYFCFFKIIYINQTINYKV